MTRTLPAHFNDKARIPMIDVFLALFDASHTRSKRAFREPGLETLEDARIAYSVHFHVASREIADVATHAKAAGLLLGEITVTHPLHSS